MEEVSLFGQRVKECNMNDTVSSKIYTINEFLRLVRYECERSDRSSRAFSMVLYRMDKGGNERFMTFLQDRVRYIDSVGYFDDEVAGIILPATGYKSALAFVKSIKEVGARWQDIISRVAVYSYPEKWSESFVEQMKEAPGVTK
jgi:hypothetical protein